MTSANPKEVFTLDLTTMGIDIRKHPNGNNPPAFLSREAKQAWASLFKDEVIAPIFKNLPSIEEEIRMAVTLTYDMVTDKGQDFLEPTISNDVALQALIRDVTVRRQAMVMMVDKMGLLSNVIFGKIEHHVIFNGKTLEMITLANGKLDKKQSVDEYLDMLIRKHRFTKLGTSFTYALSPNGVKVVIDVTPSGLLFTLRMGVNTVYIPPKAIVPTLNPDLYNKQIMSKVWMPVLRRNRFTTLRRKNAII